jgi:hypothetical protein
LSLVDRTERSLRKKTASRQTPAQQAAAIYKKAAAENTNEKSTKRKIMRKAKKAKKKPAAKKATKRKTKRKTKR